jgi:hypothetical protein
MTTNKIWFITGAGRGMGVDIAKAALPPAIKSSLPDAILTRWPRLLENQRICWW